MWLYLLGVIVVGIVILLGVYLYFRKGSCSSSSSSSSPSIENTESNQNSDKTPELMFFYADWCGHCKKAKPEWESVKDELHNTLIKNQRVFCVEYNCSDKTAETAQILKKYKIDGFPTIKLQYDNTIYEFNEVPTKDNILIFVNNTIQ